MKLSFMTFLFPKLGYDDLIAMAVKYGYQGIEWRAEAGHNHGVELESSPEKIRQIRARMADAGLETSCLATSAAFSRGDRSARESQLERLGRFVDLAVAVGAPCIRIFADPVPNVGRGARAEHYAIQAEYIARGCEVADAASVKLALETHSSCRAYDVGELLFRTGYPPAFWVNWHLAHCLKHGEGVDEAYRHVKGRVIHAHTGLGSVHVDRQAELLAIEGFKGYFSVEMMPKEGESGEKKIAEQAAEWKAMLERLGL